MLLLLVTSFALAQETPPTVPVPTPVDSAAAAAGKAEASPADATPSVDQVAAPENDEFEMLANSKDSFSSLRDPFRMPSIGEGEDGVIRSPLESTPLDQFKIIGIITGPDKFRAMLQDPTGQTHLVSEKMKLGVRSGLVKKITGRGIWVQEKVLNVVGQEEVVDTVLKLEDMRNHRSEAPSESSTPPVPSSGT